MITPADDRRAIHCALHDPTADNLTVPTRSMGPDVLPFTACKGLSSFNLNFATIFAAAYGLIWELNPDAFTNLLAPMGETKEVGTMLYFSLTTLTTTGYGDIVAVDPFARSLTNLESVVGQFFLAITIARLVTLELRDQRR